MNTNSAERPAASIGAAAGLAPQAWMNRSEAFSSIASPGPAKSPACAEDTERIG